MRPAIFDPFGERLDLQAASAAPRRRPVRTRRVVGAVLFWALAAGLITARCAFFDPSTAFGPDAPARVASTQAVELTSAQSASDQAPVLR